MFTSDLKILREQFVAEGFDIRAAGGAVRDFLLKISPHDIDFCTNANPDEQKAVYDKYGVHYFETGIKHGTITVSLNHQCYEITSLRVDTNTDGRWAEVKFVSDWKLDSERRDLTINSMMMTFNHQIIDHFNGINDLQNGVIRLVGDANKRLQEDYLRILRCYRFWGRFGKGEMLQETQDAITKNAEGLKNISRERIWQEMYKILLHENCYQILSLMKKNGVFPYINIHPEVNVETVRYFRDLTTEPVVLLAIFCMSMPDNNHGLGFFDKLCIDWKLSSEEAALGKFVVKNFWTFTIKEAKEKLTENVNRKHIFETMKVRNIWYPGIEEWIPPVFPIKGQMLMEKFSGPEMGREIKKLRKIWYESNFSDAEVFKNI
jgi:tRNA nucleotidyltransferase/poly(A) polymerase